jgi:putative oxygen-independent coproporphyrinogen III oxidase
MIYPALSLYIHYPWCLRKCPYCDFHSFACENHDLQQQYCSKLITDLKQDAALASSRKLISIFFGGGTPSLLHPANVAEVLGAAHDLIGFDDQIEITLEANPGTIDVAKCLAFKNAGINRISLGVQSFDDRHLATLGRIHTSAEAVAAIAAIKSADIKNFNLDIMFGLPMQNVKSVEQDLLTATSCLPQHISWYQLTLEPGSAFAEQDISLPDDDTVWAMQQQGKKILAAAGYAQYEVSAYSKAGYRCLHNLNYWQFGDYLGTGAGAHSKITHANRTITRGVKILDPIKYIQEPNSLLEEESIIPAKSLPFEFMLNALRLYEPIPLKLFEERTGLARTNLEKSLAQACAHGFIQVNNDSIVTTDLGKNFLNDLIAVFL